VHNSLSHTKKFVSCLQKQKKIKLETIIVDDGSTDGTYRFLKNKNKIEVIRGEGSLWWTGGINLAVKNALSYAKNGDYILTVNNDCTFDSDFIYSLIKVSEENNRAIVGSIEIDIEDKTSIKSGVVKVNWKKGIFYESLKKNQLKNSKSINIFDRADTLQTKGTLIPVEVFKRIGMFDQKHFPHYASDYEFFIRAKRAGFKLLVANTKIYCDSKRTGISDDGKTLKIIDLIDLAFSKKSQINVIDHLNLIRFCCPKEYKFNNYWIIIKKIIYFVSRTYPLSIVHNLLKK
jgi:GT2 family glycosyltransferase